MKKKILVPIMALAIAVTAGVNYKMIDSSVSSDLFGLVSQVKQAFADAEYEMSLGCDGTPDCNCSRCAENDCYGESDSTCSSCGEDTMMCDDSGGGCDVSAQGCPNCD